MEPLCTVLNCTEWKVLIWAKNPALSEEFGLEDFTFVKTIQGRNKGGEMQTFWVYTKDPFEDDEEMEEEKKDEEEEKKPERVVVQHTLTSYDFASTAPG
jgi:hypothetical protein